VLAGCFLRNEIIKVRDILDYSFAFQARNSLLKLKRKFLNCLQDHSLKRYKFRAVIIFIGPSVHYSSIAEVWRINTAFNFSKSRYNFLWINWISKIKPGGLLQLIAVREFYF